MKTAESSVSEAEKRDLKREFEKSRSEDNFANIQQKLKIFNLEDLSEEQKRDLFLGAGKRASEGGLDSEAVKRVLQNNHGPLPETVKNIDDLMKILKINIR